MTSLIWCCIVACASAGCFVAAGQVMTGRPVAVPANSSDVWRAARFALSEFNRADDEDLFAYKIINITSAKIQVVAGIKYILEVQLGRTLCRKKDTADPEPCVLQNDSKKLCHFIVTEIPWEDATVLTQKNCV
ncbi:cystatin-like [Myripristis murdjan]|uniref:Cystatin-like n=1 Tax=Myripristis murdjan TaxID=586833 RepID=A0A667XK87_9TELE|nr:cystatin-like [Myripristis murdjan]